MLSAFILVDPANPGFDADRGVVKTLAALVRLVVPGVVADATVVTRPNQRFAGLESIAGCTIVENDDIGLGFAQALRGARRANAIVLAAGYAPDASFATEAEEALDTEAPPTLALLAAPETLLQRIAPAIAPAVGIVAPGAALATVARASGGALPVLRRALKARPMLAKGVRA